MHKQTLRFDKWLLSEEHRWMLASTSLDIYSSVLQVFQKKLSFWKKGIETMAKDLDSVPSLGSTEFQFFFESPPEA